MVLFDYLCYNVCILINLYIKTHIIMKGSRDNEINGNRKKN